MNGTDPLRLPNVNWVPLFAVAAAVATVVMCVVTLMSWHEARPHEGAVLRVDYDRDVVQIRDDIREIRNLVRKP